MIKFKSMKKVLAAVVSSATLLTCTTANFVSNTVTAADGANYAEALAMSLYFFDGNQCGCEVDDNPLTWRGNCHTYDAQADLNNAQGLSSSSKSAIMAQNGGSNIVDVSGGYHDAGDHVKFTMTMGFAATSLAWSYFSYPDSYKETGCEDHLMDILKEMCDYFMKVTYLDDNDEVITFCYQVADGGADHALWESPEKQTYARTTYWADASHPSGDTSGQMASALAACSLAFADKDSAYAEECLKYANALQKFTVKYPAATYDGVGSFYGSGSQADDIAWSEVWCAVANNGGTLPTGFNPSYKLTGDKCYTGNNYDGWVYSWDKVWGGYATLLAELGYEKNTYLNEVKTEFNSNSLSTSSYNAISGWGASRYNCAVQRYALELADGDANSSYAQAAKYQMDYILGNNQKSTSFLLGYGDSYPSQLHHRAANVNKTGASYVLYGSLVGGPTDSNCTYTDYWESYASTEPALDYNGCFALACAGLYELYGGDASTLDTIIANASEIDENHEFGTWYGSSEQPTTEPPTEETTEPPTPGPTRHPCNVNGDDSVNVADAVALVRFLTKQESNADYIYDANEDNKINVFDLTTVKRFVIYGNYNGY